MVQILFPFYPFLYGFFNLSRIQKFKLYSIFVFNKISYNCAEFKKEQLRVQANKEVTLKIRERPTTDGKNKTPFIKEIKPAPSCDTNTIPAKFSNGSLQIKIQKKDRDSTPGVTQQQPVLRSPSPQSNVTDKC